MPNNSKPSLDFLAKTGVISPDWATELAPVEKQLQKIYDFLDREEKAGRYYQPSKNNLLRVFKTPIDQVRVLIIGQDPYPTLGHATGLAFSVPETVSPLPKSLKNIFKELQTDLGITPPEHGDLTPWITQGVMLLNCTLSVQVGHPDSHKTAGWDTVTDHALEVLSSQNNSFVAVLWGNKAKALKPKLQGADLIESAHPSPLSARRGFFGSKPFSTANEILKSKGIDPIDWNLRKK